MGEQMKETTVRASEDAGTMAPDYRLPQDFSGFSDDQDIIDSPPAYGNSDGELHLTQDGFQTDARLGHDGRVDIKIDTSTRRLSKILGPFIEDQVAQANDLPPASSIIPNNLSSLSAPALNVVIQLVGSRGDIQPFVSIGLVLKSRGHRVRIATHPTFRSLVEELGLEFFSIGGDPVELMAFMVKNPGLLPGFNTIMQGEIRKKRRSMRKIMEGCWRSCVEPDEGLDTLNRTAITSHRQSKPFVADAIISNPPAFAHIHCAEKLGIPLHLMFTMPWSPTQAFPHPLVNIQSTNTDSNLSNYISYILVEMMTWQGLGPAVNSFRRRTLGLDPVDSTWAPGMISRLKVPYTYCWSPSLLQKPQDWGAHIDVAAFSFLSLGSRYVPPPRLLSFLREGPSPIYVGFGSIVLDDSEGLTALVFEAIRIAGVRAVISQGWCNLGNESEIPANVFMLGDCPHDWLFQHVSCVVHHGGAGTVSTGIAAGKPTVIVSFFGDQPFWGSVISKAGAGPHHIPFKVLTASNLAAAIADALGIEMLEHAKALGAQVREEHGSESAAQSFVRRLPLQNMTCDLVPSRAAAWRTKNGKIRLCPLAAAVLCKRKIIDTKDLVLYRPCEINLSHGPWEPISGGLLAVTGIFFNVFKGFGEIGSDLGRITSAIESVGRQNSSSSIPDSTPSDQKSIGSGSLKGMTRIAKATFFAPMHFTFAMAQGAHNAPRIWGDKTVRESDKITGLGTGVLAGAKELVLGTYDAVSGLFTQPILGAMDDGVQGAIKGLGKGFVGAPVKMFAAMNGTVGYPLKGLDLEITKMLGRNDLKAVEQSRLAQGRIEISETGESLANDIIRAWYQKLDAVKRDMGKA